LYERDHFHTDLHSVSLDGKMMREFFAHIKTIVNDLNLVPHEEHVGVIL